MAITIRTSDRAAFRACRLAWSYGQRWQPYRAPSALMFGTAVHAGLESYYLEVYPEPDAQAAQEALTASLVAAMPEDPDYERDKLIDLGCGMLSHYCESVSPIIDNFSVIAVEYPFSIPVPVPSGAPVWLPPGFEVGPGGILKKGYEPIYYEGTIDLIVEQDGEYFVVDHKTTTAFSDTTFHLDVDVQISSYVWALSQLMPERPIAGFLYNEIKKNYPRSPKVLQNGALSTAKNQQTTYGLFLQSIYERGLNPYNYKEYLSYLDGNEPQFVRRHEIERSQAELSVQHERIVKEIIDMLNGPFIYPNPTQFNCRYCPYQTPCLVRAENGNDEELLNKTFERVE